MNMSNRLMILQPGIVYLWRVFQVFANFIDYACQIFGVMLLAGMWGLLLLNAIARWTDILPIGWSLEITAYLVAWSVFVMMGPITRFDEHIKISFFPERVLGVKRGTAFMRALNSLLGLFICSYLTYHSYVLVNETRHLGLTEPSNGGWEYPMWIVRSGVLLGFGVSSLYYFERTAKWIGSFFTDSQVIFEGGSDLRSSTHTEENKLEPVNSQESKEQSVQ